MMMKHTRHLRKGAALILAMALFATGCGKTAQPPGSAGEEGKTEALESTEAGNAGGRTSLSAKEGTGGDKELIAALQEKYNADLIDYSGDTIQLDRDEGIQIKLGYNPFDDEAMSVYDSFVIYQDPELTYPLDVASYYWEMDSGVLTIEPPPYGPAEYIVMDIDHSSPFLENNDESGWGNLPQLYLAVYVDTETGSPIEGNPLVTVLKINEVIKQSPQVKFSQDEYGSARFSWKEVPGAEEYFVFRIKKFSDGLNCNLNVVAATTGTQWTAGQILSMDDNAVLAINGMFKRYFITDEDWGDWDRYEEYFGVIAVNAQGCSHISNLFSQNDLAHLLPYSVAHSANNENDIYSCAGTGNLPDTMWIEMCDGGLSERVIVYDKDSIEKVGGGYNIDGKAYGTPLVATFQVTDPDWDALDQELSALEERQDKLKNGDGNVEADSSFTTGEDEEYSDAENPRKKNPRTEKAPTRPRPAFQAFTGGV